LPKVACQSGRGDPARFQQAVDEYVAALEKSIRKAMARFGIYWIPAGPDGHVKMSLIGAVLYAGRVFPVHDPFINGTFRYFEAQDKLDLAPRGFYGTTLRTSG